MNVVFTFEPNILTFDFYINRIYIMNVTQLNNLFGNIDIYLLDAILKGHFNGNMKILDVGCGEGRNLIYFMRSGYDVFGIDTHRTSIQMCRMMAGSINRDIELSHFVEADARSIPFQDNFFEAIISSAVMHFAEDEEDFLQMMSEAVRVLKRDGLLFIRMASDIGPDTIDVKNDFSFLISRQLINLCLERFSLEKIEPVKSVNVEDRRVMTTLLLKKLK